MDSQELKARIRIIEISVKYEAIKAVVNAVFLVTLLGIFAWIGLHR